MDAKEAALNAKKYFEETRTSKYFLFEANQVNLQTTEGQKVWVVNCEIKELFNDAIKKYRVFIADVDGSILDVQKVE